MDFVFGLLYPKRNRSVVDDPPQKWVYTHIVYRRWQYFLGGIPPIPPTEWKKKKKKMASVASQEILAISIGKNEIS